MSTTEPRALQAALQSPAFATRGGTLAMHVANRHVERWAPEAGASRIRSLRSLRFVDRLVTPWIESAQRSASLRLFSHYASAGLPERAAPAPSSWVFPRPWFQDELDWMAAARQVGAQAVMQQMPAPTLLTTRGTFIASTSATASAIPPVLHEYVAPSLSLARPTPVISGDAYSPLVPLAAAHTAQVIRRAVAPMTSVTTMSPNLRAMLGAMLQRAAGTEDVGPTRAARYAPELVTPPAPRAAVEETDATALAETFAEQHARLAEVQRMARLAAERELAARAPEPAPVTEAQLAEVRAARPVSSTSDPAERQRIEEKIAQRLAAMRRAEAIRLHEQAREAAARDARASAQAVETPVVETPAQPESRPESTVAAEIAAVVSALPAELATLVSASIARRPERATAAIAELGDALRTVELLARTTASGGAIEVARGPRVVMPAGLGGLVAAVDATTAFAPAQPRVPTLGLARTAAPTSALAAATSRTPAALTHIAWSDRWLARFAGARPQSLELLAVASRPQLQLGTLAVPAPPSVFVAPAEERRDDGFTVGFARDAARPGMDEPLPTLRGGPPPAQPVVRFDDDAETPDDMLAAIALAATRSRAAVVAPPQTPATAPATSTSATSTSATSATAPASATVRETLADRVAHAAPAAPGAGLFAQLASSPFAPALRHIISLGTAPRFDVRALFGANLSATYLAGLVSAPTDAVAVEPGERAVPELELPLVAPQLPRDGEELVTVRSGLLSSVDVDTRATGAVPSPARPRATAPLAQTMVETLALPMLDEAVEPSAEPAIAAPGMIAERAHAWSVAQERSVSDLAFDFVPPELVLAARVYGLGPAEAAQAARLAISGAGQLTAMASAVDRTFVQALTIDAEKRSERARVVTAYPVSEPAEEPPAVRAPSAASFGVARRAPRGAFLWPAASTAALGLTAATPESEQGMSVAALELLAAQAVAELGTYAALAPRPHESFETPAASGSVEPDDAAVIASASALVAPERREKFQALYVALSRSSSTRTWSPAARAARALALAGRGDDTVSARERAALAWDVLPVVYGAGAADDENLSTGEAAARAERRREELRAFDQVLVDSRPGLAALSARAGEALGSYVQPASSSEREVGAVKRPPTAAPELVQTGGRSAGRFGGGEVEIPAWFEAAARKMFEEKSGSSVAEGISLAELTLITAAPATQIAASSREHGSQAPTTVAATPAKGASGPEVDIEKLANEVYREVLVLMDLARARNGEPYL